ncbi:MAG: hypothetical protein KDB00_29650 [Planctomycetales bacterium]|nr:hypothetical protein [Planctomycetales bacterium]
MRLAKRSGHVSNYDESKLSPYQLPNPLTMIDGHPVKSMDDWAMRRKEILAFYEEQIYGRVPDNAPAVTWDVVDTDDHSRDGAAITKRITGTVGPTNNVPAQ